MDALSGVTGAVLAAAGITMAWLALGKPRDGDVKYLTKREDYTLGTQVFLVAVWCFTCWWASVMLGVDEAQWYRWVSGVGFALLVPAVFIGAMGARRNSAIEVEVRAKYERQVESLEKALAAANTREDAADARADAAEDKVFSHEMDRIDRSLPPLA